MHVLHAHEEECTKQREHSFHFFPHICTYIFFKRLSLVLLLQVEKPKFAPEMCLEDETVLKSVTFLQIDPAVCDIVAP